MYAKLEPISPQETVKAKQLLIELKGFYGDPELEKPSPEAAHQAILVTREYQKHLREGGKRDAATEHRLTSLWMEAGSQIRPLNSDLANLCSVKGHGWADMDKLTAWGHQAYINLLFQAEHALEPAMKPGDNPPPRDWPSWSPIAGVIFTVFTVVMLLCLLLGPQDIAPGRHIIFDVLVAFCLAASVSFLGGTAKAHGKLPWLGNSPIQFATVGGVAICLSLSMAFVSTRRSQICERIVVLPPLFLFPAHGSSFDRWSTFFTAIFEFLF